MISATVIKTILQRDTIRDKHRDLLVIVYQADICYANGKYGLALS